MCTLVALHRCTPDAFLWIAANRDEYADRPSDGPALRKGRNGLLVAPLDRRAGGTWWGVSAQGVFAALTNRPTRELDATRRSRGRARRSATANPARGGPWRARRACSRSQRRTAGATVITDDNMASEWAHPGPH